VLILIFAILTYVIYPVADARKNVGKGSTGDDAIIEPALTLLGDGKLYNVILYDGAPISPGPGWILLNSPFVLFNAFWVLSVFYVTLTVILTCFLFGKYRETNMVLFLLSSSLMFWEILVTGHDLIAIGFIFVALVSLAYVLNKNKSERNILLISLAVSVGFISTCRVVFICFPVLLSIFYWKFCKKKAVIFFVSSLLVCGTLHGYYYMINEYYQPFHLFRRGRINVGSYLSFIGLAVTIIALYFIYKKLVNTIESWMFSLFVCMSIPLTTISLGELITVGFQFSLWEGANYLMPATPLLLFIMACKVCDEKSNIAIN